MYKYPKAKSVDYLIDVVKPMIYTGKVFSRFRHFENLKTPIILINTGIAGVFFGKKCCM